jgi:NADPH2:quinone reductase
VLEVVDLPTPEPGPGEVLVRVRAAGTNPIDCAVRAGEMATASPVTGFDVAGTVERASSTAPPPTSLTCSPGWTSC